MRKPDTGAGLPGREPREAFSGGTEHERSILRRAEIGMRFIGGFQGRALHVLALKEG